MKYIVYILLFVILIMGCESNDPTLFSEYTYGKLTSNEKKLEKIYLNDVLLSSFEYNEEGLLISLTTYYSDNFSHKEEYNYNDNKQLVSRSYYGLVDSFIYEGVKLKEQISYNTENPSWNPRLVYTHDKQGKIIKAKKYHNNEPSGFIEYVYDIKGNVINRKEFMQYSGESSLFAEIKCEYDDKKLPVRMLDIYPIDMSQTNNVSYSYSFSMLMSCFPPEFISVFEYDSEGYPLKETRTSVGLNGAQEQEYRYEYE